MVRGTKRFGSSAHFAGSPPASRTLQMPTIETPPETSAMGDSRGGILGHNSLRQTRGSTSLRWILNQWEKSRKPDVHSPNIVITGTH